MTHPRGPRADNPVSRRHPVRHRPEGQPGLQRRVVTHVLEVQAHREHQAVIAEVQRQPRQGADVDDGNPEQRHRQERL
ncbi:hypothetical protein, partial [Burkholderia sp. Ax-1720]|uniref:hypothetical protein n=1 Tax=Burkholderia sp. Ax-1720 TaxID=2608335 RepID=UPI0019644B86